MSVEATVSTNGTVPYHKRVTSLGSPEKASYQLVDAVQRAIRHYRADRRAIQHAVALINRSNLAIPAGSLGRSLTQAADLEFRCFLRNIVIDPQKFAS
jgi:hypothetical protein